MSADDRAIRRGSAASEIRWRAAGLPEKLARRLEDLGYGLRRRLGSQAAEQAARARFAFDHRKPAAALGHLARAERFSPREPSLRVQKADFLAQWGRAREAQRELAAARRLHPESPAVAQAVWRPLLFSGERPALQRALGKLSGSGHELFSRGCLRLKAGEFSKAREDFARVLKTAGAEEALVRRARLYWLAARARELDYGRRAEPGFVLCGLGLFPPYTATIEALAAIGRCDILLNNIPERETREFLLEFCGSIRMLTFDLHSFGSKMLQDPLEAAVWVRRTLALLRGKRTVGYLTRGHPMIISGLGARIQQKCQALGLPTRVVAAVSCIEAILGVLSQEAALEAPAVQAFMHEGLRRGVRLDGGRPLMVFFADRRARREDVESLARILARAYPSGRPCWMCGPLYDAQRASFPLQELARRFPEIDRAQVLYVARR